MHLPYRQDIDGLRAFAVSSVVIFHAFPSLIPGGFVGVDIFFVISGFLISSIIFREIESSNFSFANFYSRRIKRIFPALITVLTTSYAFGWFFLFSDDFRRLGAHIFRAAMFLSNLLLMREAGYFDNAAETKPLLHLWSLAIEEQFYVVWPLIVWIFWRVKWLRLPLLAMITIGSFVWNVHLSQVNLNRDFYHPLPRFWELSAGAWLAFYTLRNPAGIRHSHAASGLGFVLLIGAITLIDSHKGFPGAWALLPVAGAVLVLLAGPTAWMNKSLFSNRSMIWIGAISYPLYLWHWPILAFARIVEGATPSVSVRLGALALSVLLAWLTFEWIEKPIRFSWKSSFRTPLLVIALGVIGYVGLACKDAGGYTGRPIMQMREEANFGDIGHEAFHIYYGQKFFPCADERVHSKSEKWGDLVRCFQTKRNDPIDMVLIGDSHAEHLLLGLSQALPNLNIAVYQRSQLPFSNSTEYEEVFDSLLRDPHIKYVLMTSMWAVAPLSAEEQNTFKLGLDQTIQILTAGGKQVLLTDDTPKFGFDPQRCKFSHPLSGQSHCVESSDMYRKTQASYVPMLEAAALNEHVRLIRLKDIFCDDSTCHMAKEGQIYFRDNNHVNILGSQLMGHRIAQSIGLERIAGNK